MERCATVCLLSLFVAFPSVIGDCSKVVLACLKDTSCFATLISKRIALSNCMDMMVTPPGSPPYCTQNCRNGVLKFLKVPAIKVLLHCNCSTLQGVVIFGDLCKPFQSNTLPKCNITSETTEPSSEASSDSFPSTPQSPSMQTSTFWSSPSSTTFKGKFLSQSHSIPLTVSPPSSSPKINSDEKSSPQSLSIPVSSQETVLSSSSPVFTTVHSELPSNPSSTLVSTQETPSSPASTTDETPSNSPQSPVSTEETILPPSSSSASVGSSENFPKSPLNSSPVSTHETSLASSLSATTTAEGHSFPTTPHPPPVPHSTATASAPEAPHSTTSPSGAFSSKRPPSVAENNDGLRTATMAGIACATVLVSLITVAGAVGIIWHCHQRVKRSTTSNVNYSFGHVRFGSTSSENSA